MVGHLGPVPGRVILVFHHDQIAVVKVRRKSVHDPVSRLVIDIVHMIPPGPPGIKRGHRRLAALAVIGIGEIVQQVPVFIVSAHPPDISGGVEDIARLHLLDFIRDGLVAAGLVQALPQGLQSLVIVPLADVDVGQAQPGPGHGLVQGDGGLIVRQRCRQIVLRVPGQGVGVAAAHKARGPLGVNVNRGSEGDNGLLIVSFG